MQTSLMLTECTEAADKVREQLKVDEDLYRDLGERLQNLNPSFVATLARGSSDHVASYAAYLIPQCTGHVVASLPPSLNTVLNAPLRLRGQIVLAISQSGASPDLVKGVEVSRKAEALTIGLTNHPSSDLAAHAEFILDQRAGSETSVAATKTVLCSMTAVARLVCEWSGDAKLRSALNELPDQLIEAAALEIETKLIYGRSGAFALSRALGECVARETALKLKETCGLQAEGFSTAEVQHGPREIIDERHLVVGFALPGLVGQEVVATSMILRDQGAATLIFGFEPRPKVLTDPEVMYVELPRPSDDRLAPIIALQAAYPWLARASVALGRNPDKPKNLKHKIVKTT